MYIGLWCQHDSVCQYVYLEVRSEVIRSHILHCTTEFVEVDHTPRDWIDLNPLLLSVVAILLLDRAGDERGFARKGSELHAWYINMRLAMNTNILSINMLVFFITKLPT